MFKIHDIRGKYGEDITTDKFKLLGTAAGLFGNEILIGVDYRPCNTELLGAFCSGFTGTKTVIGNAPTPATAFLSRKLGLSITASHNPAGYAGAKFFKKQTYVSEDEMAALKKRFEATKQAANAASAPTKQPELLEEYIDSLPEFKGGLYDLSGGAACAIKKVFPATIFGDPDPNFERHSPEPKDDTLTVLKEKTRKGVIGFALDGDADRVIPCDAGIVIEGDVVAAFIAQESFNKNDRIVLSIDCRQEVFDFLRDGGFKVITSKVGDPNVLQAAMANAAKFSAERSGHYSFLSHAPNSDGIYASALLSGTRPGELAEFKKQFKNVTLIEQVFVKADFAKLKELMAERAPNELVALDGVKAVFEDYALLIRASTTEPKIRINSEARTSELAAKGMALAKQLAIACTLS